MSQPGSEKPSLVKSLFHASLLVPFSLLAGWVAYLVYDLDFGLFSPLFGLIPLVVAATRKHHKPLFLASALFFFIVAFANPIWEREPRVFPKFGPEIAALTAHGVTPRTFLESPANCALVEGEPLRLQKHDGVFLRSTNELNEIHLALQDGLIIDSRFRLFGDGLLKPGIKFEELSFRDGQFKGESVKDVLKALDVFFLADSFETLPSQAWLPSNKSQQLAVYHDRFLAVFGTELYQGKNRRAKPGDELEESLGERLNYVHYNPNAKQVFYDRSFQKSNSEEAEVFLALEDKVLKKVWSRYPLPIDFRSGPDERASLADYTGTPEAEQVKPTRPVLRERKAGSPTPQPSP